MIPRILLFLFFCITSVAKAESSYLQELQSLAHDLRLDEQREWRVLLHYETDHIGSGKSSAVESAFFFASPEGRHDLRAELDATLASFFDPANRSPRDEPAQCAWTARYHWLKSKLQFDPTRLPELPCPRYQRWVDRLAPQSLALIFPDAFPNAPASMFGHTLLRLDGRGQDEHSRLLAYAINFGAEVGDNPNALSYVFKGFFGGYQGFYSLNPYYDKVREYAYIENRNIWEYPLNLSSAELERLVWHLWELRGVAFPYYFALRNCSYELLALIEAARPALNLTEQFSAYAMPVDTIRVLRSVPGLLGNAQLRASQKSRTLYEEKFLTRQERKLVMETAFSGPQASAAKLEKLEPFKRARVLETAHDRLYFERLQANTEREPTVDRALAILNARAALPIDQAFPPTPQPEISPELGHQTKRLTVAGGMEDDHPYISLRGRLAVHDLLDPPEGYIRGAQLDFFDIAARYLPELEALRIEEIKLADVVSLAPRDQLFSPVSWRLSSGAHRLPDRPLSAQDASDLAFYLEGGPGVAYGALDELLFYAFPLAALDAGGDLQGGHRLGLGGILGLRYEIDATWNLLLEYRDVASVAGDSSRERRASFIQQFNFAKDEGFRVSLDWRDWAGKDFLQGELAWEHYF